VRPEWKAIMNTDVEDLLREGMERFTKDLRAPAGLTRRAARRRRWRLTLRSLAGMAAALTAGAVALIAVQPPAAPHHGIQEPAVPAAYVVKRVDSALTAAEPGMIAQMMVTTRGAAIYGGKPGTASVTAEEWSYGDQWRSVTNSPAGRPVYDEGFSTSSGYTLVSYLTQTWARHRKVGGPVKPIPDRHGCPPLVAPLPFLFRYGLPSVGLSAASLPATVAKDLRTAVACGALVVAGWRVRAAGIEAIELKSRRHSLISETIWVNPATDLPVRVVTSSAFGPPVLRQTADITWLPPTAQNLARLTVPIPTGFRRVGLGRVVRPILQQPFKRGAVAGAGVLCLSPAGPACLGGPLGYAPGPKRAVKPNVVLPYPAPKPT
jgi:hypothetical protein